MASEFARHATLRSLPTGCRSIIGQASRITRKSIDGNHACWDCGLVPARSFAHPVQILGGFGLTDALDLFERRDTHIRGCNLGAD